MIKENQKLLNRGIVILDIVTIFLAFLLSWYIRIHSGLIEVEGGVFAVHMHRSSFSVSRVIADLAAGHVQRAALAQINRTAVVASIIV